MDEEHVALAIQKVVSEQEEYYTEEDLLVSETPVIPLPADAGTDSTRPVSLPKKGKKARIPEKPSHKFRRMEAFKKHKVPTEKKKVLEAWRIGKGVERAITVPFEFSNLGTSYTVEAISKVYSHEELAGLGINTVEWDGL